MLPTFTTVKSVYMINKNVIVVMLLGWTGVKLITVELGYNEMVIYFWVTFEDELPLILCI